MGRRGKKGRSVVGHNQTPKPSSNLEGVQTRKRRKQDDPKDNDGSFHSAAANKSDESGPAQGKGTRSRVPIGPNHQAKLPDCTFGKKDGNVAEDSADSLSCLYLGSDRTENIGNNQAPVRSSGLHPTDSMPTDAMPLLLTLTSGPPIDAPQPETTAVVHESAGEASTTTFDWSKLTEMGYRVVEVIQTWSSEVKRLKTIFVEEKDKNEHLKTMLGEEKDKNERLKIMLALDKDKNEHHKTMLAEERDRNERLKIMLVWERDKNEHYKTMLAKEKDKAEHHKNMLEEEKDNNTRLKTMLVEEKDKNKHHNIMLEEEKDKNERLKTMLSEGKVKNEHLKSMLAEEKDKNERLQLRLHGEEKDKNELLKTMLAEKKDKNDHLQLSFPKNERLPLGLQRVHTRLDECIALIDRITQKDTRLFGVKMLVVIFQTGGAGPDSYPSSVSMARGRGGRTKGGSVGRSGKRGKPSAMAEEPEGGAARKRRKQDDPSKNELVAGDLPPAPKRRILKRTANKVSSASSAHSGGEVATSATPTATASLTPAAAKVAPPTVVYAD
uniref:Uncharacterized protein n=1 Tax=Oryza glumipatula TaxID=40148 RepID=A0A0E0BQ46_9ORYZ